MINKLIFYVCFYIMAASSMMQSADSLMVVQDVYNLSQIKKQIATMQFEKIIFNAYIDATKQAKLKRHGFLVRRPNAVGTVIICHGYLGCKRDAVALKHLFPNYNVVAFDFRAHGDHRVGQVSTIGKHEAFDVIGAVQFVKADPAMSKKPLIAFGYSMGAVSAIQAQAMDATLFDAMILDCPYDSTDRAMSRGLDEKMKIKVFGRTFTIPGKQFIIDHMYDPVAQKFTDFLFKRITKFDSKKVATKFVKVEPIESIKKVTVPCLFIHCESDTKVPIIAVESLYQNKPGFKRLWITPGKAHFGSYQHNPELYWYKVNKFLTKLREQDIAQREQEKVCDQRTKVMFDNNKIVVLSFADNKKLQ